MLWKNGLARENYVSCWGSFGKRFLSWVFCCKCALYWSWSSITSFRLSILGFPKQINLGHSTKNWPRSSFLLEYVICYHDGRFHSRKWSYSIRTLHSERSLMARRRTLRIDFRSNNRQIGNHLALYRSFKSRCPDEQHRKNENKCFRTIFAKVRETNGRLRQRNIPRSQRQSHPKNETTFRNELGLS